MQPKRSKRITVRNRRTLEKLQERGGAESPCLIFGPVRGLDGLLSEERLRLQRAVALLHQHLYLTLGGIQFLLAGAG
jgi:hypothetical protein